MECLYRRWDTQRCLFGDIVVLTFVLMQCLDGGFTYLGVSRWGPAAEGNPLISSAIAHAGLGMGVAGAKLFAVALGVLLHLCRVHNIVALLTLIYLVCAILPWTAIFIVCH